MTPRIPRPFVAALAFALVSAATTPAHALNVYQWTNAAGGAATLGTNWSPAGPPGVNDEAYFGVPATFTTTWAAPVDSLDLLSVQLGNPNFSITGHLGLKDGLAIGGISSLTLSSGTIWASACDANYSALGDLAIVGVASQLDAGDIEWGSTGGGGASRIDVLNGGELFCRAKANLAAHTNEVFAGSIAHRIRRGFPLIGYAYPIFYTVATGAYAPDFVIGGQGTATLEAYDGGYLTAVGNLLIGRDAGGSGSLHVYTSPATGGVTTIGQTYVGANPTPGSAGGSGMLEIEGSGVFADKVWLGDADDTPGTQKSFLHVDAPGVAVLGNGLAMTGALTSRLDLLGGDTHVVGGGSTIQQSTPFEVGSAYGGNPGLWLEGGSSTDIWPAAGNAAALGVGRGGAGRLNVAGPGTVLTIHGALAMGDSTGGVGTATLDSAAVVTIAGKLLDGGAGVGILAVSDSGTVATVQDTALVGSASGPSGYGYINATNGARVHLLKPLIVGSKLASYLFITNGGQVDIAGLDAGPAGAGLFTTYGGATITVSDHLNILGNTTLEADTSGNIISTVATGVTSVPSTAQLFIGNGGFMSFANEVDLRGLLTMSPGTTSGLLSAPTRRMTPARTAHPARTTAYPPFVIGGRLVCPLFRLRDNGSVQAAGTIAGRFHMDSGSSTLAMTYGDQFFTGHLVVGDSTKTDGFVSIGTTTVGLDTLKVLDSDGGDLGKMTIAGGVLQLPKPGHLLSGFLLSGQGTVDGTLDVRDSAWVSFHGQVTGDVTLAGTLDLGPTVSVLVAGSLHAAPTGRTTVKTGHLAQDLIAVTGAVVAGGTLDVRTVPGDLPVVGDTLTVIVAGSVSGTFANVTINGQPGAGVVKALYRASDVRIAILGAVTGVGVGDTPGPSLPLTLRLAPVGTPHGAAIALDLPAAAHARITLFDVSGRQLASLADDALGAGRHRFDVVGRVSASGVYFLRAVVVDRDGTHVLAARVAVLR